MPGSRAMEEAIMMPSSQSSTPVAIWFTVRISEEGTKTGDKYCRGRLRQYLHYRIYGFSGLSGFCKCWQSSYGGVDYDDYDAFVAKFDSGGDIVYCSYLGGTGLNMRMALTWMTAAISSSPKDGFNRLSGYRRCMAKQPLQDQVMPLFPYSIRRRPAP